MSYLKRPEEEFLDIEHEGEKPKDLYLDILVVFMLFCALFFV